MCRHPHGGTVVSGQVGEVESLEVGEVQRSGSGDSTQRSPALHHGGAVTFGMHLLEEAGPEMA